MLAKELIDDFDGGFFTLEWNGPKVSGCCFNNGEESDVAVATLLQVGCCFCILMQYFL